MIAPVLLLGACLSGCNRPDGPSIVVAFRSADGVPEGTRVWLGDAEIGAAGTTTIVKGRARVAVTLHRRYADALPEHAAFVVGGDPKQPGVNRLVVYDLATVAPEVTSGPQEYPGYHGALELVLDVGADKAKQILDSLGELSLPLAVPTVTRPIGN